MSLEHYKFKKGDNLDAIAKKHGMKSDAIWKAPENKALVSKRKKPDALEPGDDIAISGADNKAEKAALDKSIASAKATIDQCHTMLQGYDKIQAQVDKTRVETTKELLEVIKRLKADQKGADLSAAILTAVASSLSKLSVTAAKAATLEGAELAAANKEMLKTAGEMTYMPLEKAWHAGVIQLGNAGGAAVEAVGTAATWLDNLTKPSWWAQKIYGKDPADDITKLIGENNSHAADIINNLKTKRTAVTSRLAEMEKLVKDLQSKQKDLH